MEKLRQFFALVAVRITCIGILTGLIAGSATYAYTKKTHDADTKNLQGQISDLQNQLSKFTVAQATPTATPTATATPAATTTPTAKASATPTSNLTLADLNSAEYNDPQLGNVTLKDGKYTAPPSATSMGFGTSIDPKSTAFGDLNGDGQGDAIVALQATYGGSGVFPYFYVVMNQNGKPVSYPSTPEFLKSKDWIDINSGHQKGYGNSGY